MRIVLPQLDTFIPFSRTCAVAFLGCVFASVAATAQPGQSPKYQFDRWTTDDGLPQNAVTAILQTRDGYLWLATSDGLARFDGLQFTVFNKGNSKGIGSNRFAMLFEDRHGALWAVTDEDWLVKYQAGAFTTYTPKDGLPAGEVKQIEEDESGGLQIVIGKWLVRFKDGRFSSQALDDLLRLPIGAGRSDCNKLARLEDGRLHWYSHGRLTTYSLPPGWPDFKLCSIYEDQRGIIWLATENAGLVSLRDGRFTVYPVRERFQIGGPVQADRKGSVWMSGDYSWLGSYSNGRFTRYTAQEGFQPASANCFYEDREGNFWIGASDGLYRARETAIMVLTRQDGLPSNGVYSICEDRAGQMWFGTWGGGVAKLGDGRFTHYPMKNGQSAGFITALYEDRAGNMWIGNMGGVFRLDQAPASNPRGQGKPSAITDADGFFRHGVWAIHQDRAGRFWFGTSRGLVKDEDGRRTRYTTIDGLAGDDIKAILEAHDGTLWFGTWSGLTRYAEGRFTAFTERDGLASDHIRALYEDADGTLWIGTYDGGLSRFKNGRLARFTTNDGLFSNGVFQILEDADGYFWMSGNQGIHRVRRQELNDFADGKLRSITSVAYGKADGLLTVECNGGRQPAGWKTREGRLWFPTAQGAAVIDPSRVEANREPPPVVIEEVRLNDRTVPPGETIVIPPDQNSSLEIRYQALSFIRSKQQRFRYKLDGMDGDWVEAGNRRAAYYSHLPPGQYAFTVLAANGDGVWNTQGAHLRLKVLPAFWQTWWFRAAVAASLLAISLFAVQLRLARFKREQTMRDAHARQLIDSQERDRQRIAQDIHDSTGQLVSLINRHALDGLDEPEKQELATEHFARIASYAGKAINELRSVAYSLHPAEIDRLGLTRALAELVRRFNVSYAIEFTCDVNSPGNSIDSSLPGDGKVHLYRIVQECFNNIARHSQATKASLVVRREAKALRIEIRDNGQGFDQAAESNGNRVGLGLSGITERARLLGGRAEIASAPGQGVQVTIIINLPEATS